MTERKRTWRSRFSDDGEFLHLIDRGEQQLTKLLALVLCAVIAAATVQMVLVVGPALLEPGNRWMGDDLTTVLGDLLNILIALEVLQNITSYLRKHVVQIELVLLTAITAVARKVIVLPPGAENKPQLLVGLGIAVLCLAAAFWLVRSLSLRQAPARTGPAIRSQEPDPFAPHDGVGGG